MHKLMICYVELKKNHLNKNKKKMKKKQNKKIMKKNNQKINKIPNKLMIMKMNFNNMKKK